MSVEAFERALSDELLAQPDLAAVVENRVYKERVPQLGSKPAIRIRRIGSNPVYSLENELGVMQAAYEIAALVKGETGQVIVSQMADAIRNLLSGFCGMLGESPNEVDVQGCLIAADNSLYQPPQDATDAGTFSHVFDCRFTFNQAVPTHA